MCEALEIDAFSFESMYLDESELGSRFVFWGPEDLTTTRADAIWLSEDFTSRVKNVAAGISHPKGIRAAFNDQQALLENSDPVLKEAPVPVWSG
jgi:hypothetical protein